MTATAVIGANFGDEGKGRMVHHFASTATDPAIVVRYNGGAQAGHTVLRKDGAGHIFHHFGAGTLAGCPTYLSEFFITNPLMWRSELDELEKLHIKPVLYIHPNAPVTTFYDMLINRETERSRGSGKHGSCGYGVAETVERLCSTPYHLFARDIGTPRFKEMLATIRKEHVPQRLVQLGITKPSENFQLACDSDLLLEEYLCAASDMVPCAKSCMDYDLRRWGHVIFEGAQGLCLDENHAFFPHVTRSRTGLPNILSICKGADIRELEVVYVTRAYMTRHGAGPFPTEVPSLHYEDGTNVENEWQGKIRFGHLDLDLMRESVRNDLRKAKGVKISISVAVTCLDQVDDVVQIKHQGRVMGVSRDSLPALVAGEIGAEQVYCARRP